MYAIRSYYDKGRIPQAVEAAAKKGGGILSAADFADYSVSESAPVTCDYRGYVFHSAPPPSSGGTTMCQILNTLEGYVITSYSIHYTKLYDSAFAVDGAGREAAL